MKFLKNPTENEQIIGLLTTDGRSAWAEGALIILEMQKYSEPMLIKTFISRAAARLITRMDFGTQYGEYAMTFPTLFAMKGIFPDNFELFFVKDGILKPKKGKKHETI